MTRSKYFINGNTNGGGRCVLFLRRNNLEVLAKILELTEKGKRKTNIMYQCNLSYPATVRAINFLLERGMIEKRSPLYYTTSKGLEFLMKFRELEQLLKAGNTEGDANLKQ
jgi:predicted transcriptional regulator